MPTQYSDPDPIELTPRLRIIKEKFRLLYVQRSQAYSCLHFAHDTADKLSVNYIFTRQSHCCVLPLTVTDENDDIVFQGTLWDLRGLDKEKHHQIVQLAFSQQGVIDSMTSIRGVKTSPNQRIEKAIIYHSISRQVPIGNFPLAFARFSSSMERSFDNLSIDGRNLMTPDEYLLKYGV